MVEKNENCSGAVNGSGKPNGLNAGKSEGPDGKAKENLLEFTGQLVSLSTLQQAILRNLQKEIENI